MVLPLDGFLELSLVELSRGVARYI